MINIRTVRHKVPFLAALIILLSMVMLFHFSGSYALNLVRESKERDLGERLLSIGKTVVSGITEERLAFLKAVCGEDELDVELLRLFYNQLPSVEEFQTLLTDVREQTDLKSLMLVHPDFHVILAAESELAPGTYLEELGIDTKEMTDTEKGLAVTSPLYRVEDNPHKRAYLPIQDADGTLIAILRLEASRGYFTEIKYLQHLISRGTFFVTVMIALIAFILYQLLRALMRAEEAVAAADRFKSLGTLVAGVAHELRNPLGIIRATAEGLQIEAERAGEVRQMARDIVEETDRLNTLLNQFLQFARPSEAPIGQKTELTEALPSIIKWVEKSVDTHKIEMEVSYNGNKCPVAMDERSVRQVMLNIVLNAREAIDDKGTIAIAVSTRKNRTIVEVTDNGRGIPVKTLKNVFDPFFTTKPSGTGLGLSITRQILERFGGKIDIQSTEKKGTVVTLDMPSE